MQIKNDIIIPTNNEEILLNRCISMGIREVILAYKKITNDLLIKLKKLQKLYKINIKYGIIINSKKSSNYMLRIKRQYPDLIIIINYEPNKDIIRNIIERVSDIYIYNIEFDKRVDFIHQRNSGINHILAKIISKNNISLIINFNNYILSSKKDQARILGRIKQNLLLAKKFSFNYNVKSFANYPYEIKSSLSSLKRVLTKNHI